MDSLFLVSLELPFYYSVGGMSESAFGSSPSWVSCMAMPQPTDRHIYHITHVSNLAKMVEADGLWSDREMAKRGGPSVCIGMNHIKQRRLSTPVSCHAGRMVGDFVPFYFCPRSIMLYVIWRGDNVDLAYTDGQEPIVHLQADLDEVLGWADQAGVPWAYTNGNAGAAYTEHYTDLSLEHVDWAAVAARDWKPTEIREHKQAEFLLYGHFPWTLVRSVGVVNGRIQTKASDAIAGSSHQPPVIIRRDWYYL